MLDVISLETPQRKWASSRLEGRTSCISSSCGRCSRLTTGTSGTSSGGLRKGQSPFELLGGLSGFLSSRCRGLRPCVESVPEPEDSSPVLTWFGVLLESPQGSQSSSRVMACTCTFLPSCRSSVALPFEWIKGSVAFPRGFPTRLSHEAFPQGCPTCHRGVSRSSASKSRQCRENSFPWNGLRHLGDSGNGGTTLEFLSPFLWRAPPLEMRRERGEFFPHLAGKGSHLSS